MRVLLVYFLLKLYVLYDGNNIELFNNFNIVNIGIECIDIIYCELIIYKILGF